jgi:hydroxyacylglutathione hydrolase
LDEFETGSAPGAINVPLDALESAIERIDPTRPITLVCGSGFRSSIAGSILESSGFTDITNVDGGGMRAYQERGFALVQPV